jgi:imidazolonepropionase-like amidohydrolase
LLIRGAEGDDVDRRLAQMHRAVQAENLRLLDRAGGVLLIGTDQSGEIFTEVEHLAALGAFSSARLLAMVFETGGHLFPDRRIGCFDVGCEADFLVLSSDPLVSIDALRAIEMRIKAGRLVSAPA